MMTTTRTTTVRVIDGHAHHHHHRHILSPQNDHGHSHYISVGHESSPSSLSSSPTSWAARAATGAKLWATSGGRAYVLTVTRPQRQRFSHATSSGCTARRTTDGVGIGLALWRGESEGWLPMYDATRPRRRLMLQYDVEEEEG